MQVLDPAGVGRPAERPPQQVVDVDDHVDGDVAPDLAQADEQIEERQQPGVGLHLHAVGAADVVEGHRRDADQLGVGRRRLALGDAHKQAVAEHALLVPDHDHPEAESGRQAHATRPRLLGPQGQLAHPPFGPCAVTGLVGRGGGRVRGSRPRAARCSGQPQAGGEGENEGKITLQPHGVIGARAGHAAQSNRRPTSSQVLTPCLNPHRQALKPRQSAFVRSPPNTGSPDFRHRWRFLVPEREGPTRGASPT
jgi:hypothetical protein